MSEYTIPQEALDEIRSEIATVAALLEKNSGNVSEHVIRIHKHLLEKPECMALIPSSEVATLIEGIEKTTSRQIVEGKKASGSPKKKYRDTDIDLDL